MPELIPEKRPKIRYVPGMISALAVPLLFTFYGVRNLSKLPHYHAMEVNWRDKDFHPKNGKMWTVPKRQYLTLTLTGRRDSDALRLQFGELYIREIYENKDTINGVKFVCSPTSWYYELVAVLDITHVNNITYYSPSDLGILLYYARDDQRYNQGKALDPMPL